MANDEYLVGENQCVYSENLDCYRDPRYLQLAPAPVAVSNTLSALPTVIEDGYTGADELLFFSDDKNVYRVDITT